MRSPEEALVKWLTTVIDINGISATTPMPRLAFIFYNDSKKEARINMNLFLDTTYRRCLHAFGFMRKVNYMFNAYR